MGRIRIVMWDLLIVCGLIANVFPLWGQINVVSPTLPIFFGTFPTGSSSPPVSVTIVNGSQDPLTLNSVFSSDPSFVATLPGPAPIFLDIGQQIIFTVTFSPNRGGNIAGQIVMVGTDQAKGVSFQNSFLVRGVGLAPQINVQPSSINFGNQAVGLVSPPISVTIQNIGTNPLLLFNIVPSDTRLILSNLPPLDSAGKRSSSGSGPHQNSLAPGGSTTFNVSFQPAKTGPFNGTLTILSNDPLIPNLILNVTGAGVSINISPNPVTFGQQAIGTTSLPQSVTIQNPSANPLTVAGISSNNPAFVVTGAPSTIGPGSTGSFNVAFAPSTTGNINGLITINLGVGTAAPLSIQVTGVGVQAVGLISVTPRSLSFGTQLVGTGSAPQSLQIQNVGTGTLTILSVAVDNTSFLLGTTAPLISAGASAGLSVTFQPGTTGSVLGTITINSSDPDNPVVRIAVSGTGTNPALNTSVAVVNPNLVTAVAAHQAAASVSFVSPATPLSTLFPVSLKLKFTAAISNYPGAQDATIRFNPALPTTYGIPAGQLSSPSANFFTGTLAGTITVSASNSGGPLGQALLTVPAAAPVITQLAVTTTSNSIQLNVTGFDTTRGVSQATFVFLGSGGEVINPGPIVTSVTAPFTGYFSSPAAQAVGSMFLMTAGFTVSGNVADIASVQVTLTNAVGNSVPHTLQFSSGTQSFPLPKAWRHQPTTITLDTRVPKSEEQSGGNGIPVVAPLLGVAAGPGAALYFVKGIGEWGVVDGTTSFPGQASLIVNSPAGDTALVMDSSHHTLTRVSGISSGQVHFDTLAVYREASLIRYSRDGNRAVIAGDDVPFLRTLENVGSRLTSGSSVELPDMRRVRLSDVAISNDGLTVVAAYRPTQENVQGEVLVLRPGKDERTAVRYWFDDPVAVVLSADGKSLYVADGNRNKIYRIDDYAGGTGSMKEVFDVAATGSSSPRSLVLDGSDNRAAVMTSDFHLLSVRTDSSASWSLVESAVLEGEPGYLEYLKGGALLVEGSAGHATQVIGQPW